jgi:hypothetical protein
MGKSRGTNRSITEETEARQAKRSGETHAKRMARNSTKQWESLIDDELEDTLLLLEDDEFEVFEEAS